MMRRNPLPQICDQPFVQNGLGRPVRPDGSDEQRKVWVGYFATDDDVEAWIATLSQLEEAVLALNTEVEQASALYGRPELVPKDAFLAWQSTMAKLTQDKLHPRYESYWISDSSACERLYAAASDALSLCKALNASREKFRNVASLGDTITGGEARETNTGISWGWVGATVVAGAIAYLWLRGGPKPGPLAADKPVANPQARALTR